MIINARTKEILTSEVNFAKTFLEKALGLMFSNENKNKGLVFIFNKEKIISLHMMFVFYPIDILWLDKNKEVVEMKHNLRPFTFYYPKKKAQYVIEVSTNKIKKVKIGDKILFSKRI